MTERDNSKWNWNSDFKNYFYSDNIRSLITEHHIKSYNDFIEINLKMLNQISRAGGSILAVLYCPSLPTDGCLNRKPETGMFSEIAGRLNISLDGCFSIGDSPRDIDASLSYKCRPLGLRTGNGKNIENNSKYNIPMFNDLNDAVDYVIKQDTNN